MRRKPLLAAATTGALFCLSGPAYPAVPEISGTYAVSVSVICQSNQTTGAEGVAPGLFAYEWSIADFNEKAGTAQITTTFVDGSLVVPNAASNLTQGNSNATDAYSQTSSTLTLAGTKYNVVYGLVVKDIAETFMFGGILTGQASNSCAESGTAIRTTSPASLQQPDTPP